MDFDTLPQEMYVTYLERRKVELERLKQAAAEGRIEDFKVVGHQLKGNAPSYGFEDLAVIARKLELVTVETVSTDGQSLLKDYEQWLTNTQAKLHA